MKKMLLEHVKKPIFIKLGLKMAALQNSPQNYFKSCHSSVILTPFWKDFPCIWRLLKRKQWGERSQFCCSCGGETHELGTRDGEEESCSRVRRENEGEWKRRDQEEQ